MPFMGANARRHHKRSQPCSCPHSIKGRGAIPEEVCGPVCMQSSLAMRQLMPVA